VQLNTSPLPPEVPLIIGDVIQNLRAPFDYLAAGISGDKGVKFPFNKDPLQPTPPSTGPLQSACPELWNLIANVVKPDETGNFPLWALNKLSVTDKHRLLTIQVTSVTGISFEDANYNVVHNHTVTMQSGGTANIGANYRPPINIHNKGKAILSVLFDKGQFFEGAEVVRTLNNLSVSVAQAAEFIEIMMSRVTI
jgi:hypothetical protein